MSYNTEEKKYNADDIKTEDIQVAQELYQPVEAPNSKWAQIKQKVTTKDGWIGDYDYRALWYITIYLYYHMYYFTNVYIV